MPHESIVSKQVVAMMPHVAWVLLGKYLAVVNYDRLARGQKAINYKQLLGAIVARVMIEHGQEIGRSFEEVWLSAHKESLPHFYSTDQLAAIASASRTDIPDVFRIGYRERSTLKYKQQARRTLLSPSKGPNGAPTGSVSLAREIPGGGLSIGTGFSFRKKKARRSIKRRSRVARPSDD